MNPAAIRRIALVTDFGDGLYVGQMRARLGALLPELPLIDLVHDLPPFRPDLAAYLLPALVRDMPGNTLYLCVVDPGVGGDRALLAVESAGDWLIGPDNGLLAPLIQQADGAVSVWRIGWRPERMSSSFHGRDWIAPAAARLCLGQELRMSCLETSAMVGSDWPQERGVILYVDRFGNLISGLHARGRDRRHRLQVGEQTLRNARTFCQVVPGESFWYKNAFGLVEIAVNRGRADDLLGLAAGDPIGPFIALPDAV
ncbi:SAM hydrolase/SAM-dependent halogenase family protein [Thiocystis violascens]|uniref:SAM-dependent chlorinase/fluorinase n=1 Tax=Thiocystis violascens (strain ATCC 17096 / DSM 198 / 6111) TaxID=765911 RepID=I3YGC3_THIV6|nr:SAM-dependent chlorinase/fluorinase [Thiocystis violascens]AFL76041.1 hypothetical protein Thivi_4228 [Thiocystis violascens DSM 198]